MAKTGGHPLNLTRDNTPSNYSDLDRAIHETRRLFQPYFAPVVIGNWTNKAGIINRIYSVPLIMLFMDEYSRNKYLEFSINLTDETSLSLRRMLSDEENIERRVQKMVRKIGDTCKERGIRVFEYKTVSYTELNQKTDGNREMFRIALDGSKSKGSGNSNVHDLTDLYFAPTIERKNATK